MTQYKRHKCNQTQVGSFLLWWQQSAHERGERLAEAPLKGGNTC
jgi:hypothetical protein